MKLVRSEKFAAVLILLAAVLGFIFANSSVAGALEYLMHLPLNFGTTLELEKWVSELGLAFFFLLIGIELRHEFAHGSFREPKNAFPPLVAAILGVAAPALIYAAVNFGDSSAIRGWAIPTATDVTFAMAVFLLFGQRLPTLARTFLLTVVVADDLIAIIIIAVLYPTGFQPAYLGLGAMLAVCFWGVFRCGWKPWVRFALGAVLGLAIWFCFLESGIHPVIAGVILGALLPDRASRATEKAIVLPTNLVILPLFAAFSAAVSVSQIGELNGIFIGIMLGPIGKVIGIAVGGWLGYKLIKSPNKLSFANLARLGALGGIGFTVSLLVAQLSFRDQPELASQSVFAVLVASVVTIVLGSVALATAKRT